MPSTVAPGIRKARALARPRVVLTVASTSRRLVAGMVDLVPIALLSVAAWYLGAGQFRTLIPADLGFLPEHLADLYHTSPWAILRPLLVPSACAVLWNGLWLAAVGATPGKWLAGMRVVGPDGGHLDLVRLTLRLCGYGLSIASAGLGWWLSFILPSRRALHDIVSDSYVVLAARTGD